MKLAVLSSRESDQSISLRNTAVPLEDALAELPGATLVAPSGLRHGRRSSSPGWFAAARTVRRADAVFWSQLHLRPPTPVWTLAYVRPTACRGVLAFDAFEGAVHDLARLVSAQRMAVCFVAYRQAETAIRLREPRLDVRWLPTGFARDVFLDLGDERDIYAFWLGRRYEPLHRALVTHCHKAGLQYVYSRGPNDPATLEELRLLAARSRYFLVTPPDLNDARRTGSFSPLTSRYIEGLGAGCRLLGVLPKSGEFETLFPLDAIVQCNADGSDLTETLRTSDADPEFEQKRVVAHDLAHRKHGWEERARVIHDCLAAKLEEE